MAVAFTPIAEHPMKLRFLNAAIFAHAADHLGASTMDQGIRFMCHAVEAAASVVHGPASFSADMAAAEFVDLLKEHNISTCGELIDTRHFGRDMGLDPYEARRSEAQNARFDFLNLMALVHA